MHCSWSSSAPCVRVFCFCFFIVLIILCFREAELLYLKPHILSPVLYIVNSSLTGSMDTGLALVKKKKSSSINMKMWKRNKKNMYDYIRRGDVSCQRHKNKRFLCRFFFSCSGCGWNVSQRRVDTLTPIWINLRKTYVTTRAQSERTSPLSVFKAQTNVFGQSDNEHDFQCAETDCLWQLNSAHAAPSVTLCVK